MTFKIEIFMNKVNPNNGNETKADNFPRDILKSDIIFHWLQILKYFNEFYNWHLLIHCRSDYK